jgi:RNA polymerase sigma factor (sigma-70 family)
MVDDAELLRRYAEEKSETAFAELVQRHLDLVYSAALRRLAGDTHAAADVAQQVFTALARQAASLTRCALLPGWLYGTTRHVAVDFIRAEQRRRAREREAQTMNELNSSPPSNAVWDQLRPLLDAAMDELSAADREIVVLHFFARRPFADIGAALRVSEDAARMRLDRALEKLRILLSRRGVTSTTAALGLALGDAAAGAPAGLASSIARAVLAEVVSGAGRATLMARFAALATLPAGAVAGLVMAASVAVLGFLLLERAETKRYSDSTTVATRRASPPMLQDAGRFRSGVPSNKASSVAAGPESNAVNGFLAEAWKYEQAKQYALAIEAYTAAIELDPKNYEGYFGRAGIYGSKLPVKDRDYGKAVADYTRALEIKPRDVSARHNRALDYEQLREFDQALADYSQIIEGDEDFSSLVDGRDKQVALDYEYRGRIYQENLHDYTAAISDYNEALRLDPTIEMVLYRRAVTYQALKQFDAAEADFSAAYDRDPDYPNLLASWAWQLATAPDVKYRDGEAALRFALRANEKLGDRVAEHLDALAAAYAENGRFDDAVETERMALSSAVGYQLKLKPAMQQRLQLYEAKMPFRDN